MDSIVPARWDPLARLVSSCVICAMNRLRGRYSDDLDTVLDQCYQSLSECRTHLYADKEYTEQFLHIVSLIATSLMKLDPDDRNLVGCISLLRAASMLIQFGTIPGEHQVTPHDSVMALELHRAHAISSKRLGYHAQQLQRILNDRDMCVAIFFAKDQQAIEKYIAVVRDLQAHVASDAYTAVCNELINNGGLGASPPPRA